MLYRPGGMKGAETGGISGGGIHMYEPGEEKVFFLANCESHCTGRR